MNLSLLQRLVAMFQHRRKSVNYLFRDGVVRRQRDGISSAYVNYLEGRNLREMCCDCFQYPDKQMFCFVVLLFVTKKPENLCTDLYKVCVY